LCRATRPLVRSAGAHGSSDEPGRARSARAPRARPAARSPAAWPSSSASAARLKPLRAIDTISRPELPVAGWPVIRSYSIANATIAAHYHLKPTALSFKTDKAVGCDGLAHRPCQKFTAAAAVSLLPSVQPVEAGGAAANHRPSQATQLMARTSLGTPTREIPLTDNQGMLVHLHGPDPRRDNQHRYR
jgi:hypothetical protein